MIPAAPAPVRALARAAAALLLLAVASLAPEPVAAGEDDAPAPGADVLFLYCWSESIPDTILARFTEKTGIRVQQTTYDSNEAMYAKLRLLQNGPGYDIAVPSTYYVNRMWREGMLREIDTARLANHRHLDPKLLHQPFDPENKYSIPFMWGTTGILVNTDLVEEEITSWADLWRPEFRDRVLLSNDVREVFHVALVTLGHSGNSTDPAEIEAAYEKLRELMPNVRAFNSDAPRLPYLAGEADLGFCWNGEAYMGAQEMPSLRFVYPSEGVIMWIDSFVIPANAPNPDAAHAFLDFMMEPEVAKEICEELGYATPNLAAVALLDEELRENRTVYPTEQELRGGEFQVDVGEALLLYQRYWDQLRAGR